MIVKIHRSGTSFKALAQYLGHDTKAETADRVAWTHVLNCAHDDVGSAVDSMLWTYRQADFLKAEAGIAPGGRRVEKPTKHVTLGWHPDEEPSPEEMIAAVESYLGHMGWSKHEAILFAHDDKDHPHVHILLNRIDPENGTALDDGFDKRRSQEWALAYEREHGIFCEQRLLPEEERTPSPTRATWEALREYEKADMAAENALRKFEADYMAREENRKILDSEEWKILKASQRAEREAFFAEGKEQYSEIRNQAYREVREIFREEWSEFFQARRKGEVDHEELADWKEYIVERQRAALDEYRDEYSRLLREERDADYRDILDAQRDERAALRERQEEGLRSYQLLDAERTGVEGHTEAPLAPESPGEKQTSIWDGFREAATEVCDDRGGFLDIPEIHDLTPAENPRARDGVTAATDLGGGLIGGLAIVGEKLFDGFFGGDAPKQRQEPVHRPAPSPKEHWEKVRDNPFLQVAEQARQAAIQQEEEARSRAWWDDRERYRD